MKNLKYLAFGVIGLGVLTLIVTLTIYGWNERESLSLAKPVNDEKLGSLGSLVSGIVGSLWSLGSVLLFYIALTEQREDMKVNKENLVVQTRALEQQVREFELQRAELEETRKVYVEQTKTQGLQRFENTFFNMLNQHDRITSSLSINGSFTGKDAFRHHNSSLTSYTNENDVLTIIEVIRRLENYFHGQQQGLTHYFKNLYHILTLIDKADIEDKVFYSGLFAAQLPSHELYVVYYYGLTAVGSQIKPLLEQYQFFKGLNVQGVQPKNLRDKVIILYSANAYGHLNYSFALISNTPLGENQQ